MIEVEKRSIAGLTLGHQFRLVDRELGIEDRWHGYGGISHLRIDQKTWFAVGPHLGGPWPKLTPLEWCEGEEEMAVDWEQAARSVPSNHARG